MAQVTRTTSYVVSDCGASLLDGITAEVKKWGWDGSTLVDDGKTISLSGAVSNALFAWQHNHYPLAAAIRKVFLDVDKAIEYEELEVQVMFTI